MHSFNSFRNSHVARICTNFFQEISPVDDKGWTERKSFEASGRFDGRFRRFFRPFTLRRPEDFRPFGHPDSKFVFSRVLSLRIPAERPGSDGLQKEAGKRARKIKTEGMVKSVKRLRKNRSVLGVRNRILSGGVASGKWRRCTPAKSERAEQNQTRMRRRALWIHRKK